MPGKPPYFPFYPKDFVGDGVVGAMSTEQVGAYTLLLCRAWVEEPAGIIPDDDATLAKWAAVSPERWAEIKAGVLAAFTHGPDGRWHQKRMKHEYAKLATALKKKSRGGRKGARNRHGYATDIPDGIPSGIPTNNATIRTYDSDSGSPAAGLRGGGAGGGADGFETFWSAYPRKIAKVKALSSWQKLAPDADLQAKMLAALERHKASSRWQKDDGEFIPHPTTWLNQRRWEDELPSGSNGDPKRQQFSGIDEFERRMKEAQSGDVSGVHGGHAVHGSGGECGPGAPPLG